MVEKRPLTSDKLPSSAFTFPQSMDHRLQVSHVCSFDGVLLDSVTNRVTGVQATMNTEGHVESVSLVQATIVFDQKLESKREERHYELVRLHPVTRTNEGWSYSDAKFGFHIGDATERGKALTKFVTQHERVWRGWQQEGGVLDYQTWKQKTIQEELGIRQTPKETTMEIDLSGITPFPDIDGEALGF